MLLYKGSFIEPLGAFRDFVFHPTVKGVFKKTHIGRFDAGVFCGTLYMYICTLVFFPTNIGAAYQSN